MTNKYILKQKEFSKTHKTNGDAYDAILGPKNQEAKEAVARIAAAFPALVEMTREREHDAITALYLSVMDVIAFGMWLAYEVMNEKAERIKESIKWAEEDESNRT